MLGTRHGIIAQSHHVDVQFLGTFTSISNVNIGPARPDRVIVGIALNENDGSGVGMGTITMNGSNAINILQPLMSDWIGMLYKNIPAGTTLSMAGGWITMNLWKITGLANNSVFSAGGGGSGASSFTSSLSAPATPGIIIAGARSRNSSSGWSAAAVSGINNLALNNSYNQAGGSNPSIGVASAKLDGAGTTASLNINNSGYVQGYGVGAVFY